MKISKLKVMKSAAGWYIGRSYEEPDMPGVEFPYSRDSGYFPDEVRAARYLENFSICQGCMEFRESCTCCKTCGSPQDRCLCVEPPLGEDGDIPF